MTRKTLPVSITVDGLPVVSVTGCVPATAHVLVLTTTIADPGAPIGLHSCYVGQRAGQTLATHLALVPHEAHGRAQTVTHAPGILPVADDERHPCLYDHLQHLLATLHAEGHAATISVREHAIELIDS